MAASVILASGSPTRAAMLERAGIPFERDRPAVDEDAVKQAMRAGGSSVAEVAAELSRRKAMDVAMRRPGCLVIGADQMLDCEGRWFDKPADTGAAADHLRALSGRTHELITSAVVVEDGVQVWHALDRARLTMRPLGEPFIAAYLDAIGTDATSSVGAYQLEGRGAQLFQQVEGDFFTILGLPLLPLLAFLRQRGVVPR